MADFMYMQSLSKRFPSTFVTFSDVCLEQTTESLRMVCIHEPVTAGKPDIEVDDCLVSRVDELIQKQVLIPVLIKLVTFMCQLRDSYYFEYEITNHNLYVNGDLEVCLVNQILPLQYRLEYSLIMSSIYEEDQFEMNELLLVKKFIFLLIALATEDGVKEYADIKTMLR